MMCLLLLGVGATSVYAQQQQRKDTLVVARDGTGEYRNIQEAVEAVRAFMDYTVTIYIKNGIYKEKLVIPSWVKNVQLVGESAEKTINVIIDNCIDKQIITNYSNSISLCYTILKYVFASKIIDFKEISIKINKQKEEKLATNTEYYITVGIYDSKEAEGIFEEQVDNLKLLNVKTNKKINLILK